jgi:hypothetical protein
MKEGREKKMKVSYRPRESLGRNIRHPCQSDGELFHPRFGAVNFLPLSAPIDHGQRLVAKTVLTFLQAILG